MYGCVSCSSNAAAIGLVGLLESGLATVVAVPPAAIADPSTPAASPAATCPPARTPAPAAKSCSSLPLCCSSFSSPAAALADAPAAAAAVAAASSFGGVLDRAPFEALPGAMPRLFTGASPRGLYRGSPPLRGGPASYGERTQVGLSCLRTRPDSGCAAGSGPSTAWTSMPTDRQTDIHTHMHACMHACTHTRPHARMHLYTCMHA